MQKEPAVTNHIDLSRGGWDGWDGWDGCGGCWYLSGGVVIGGVGGERRRGRDQYWGRRFVLLPVRVILGCSTFLIVKWCYVWLNTTSIRSTSP